MTERRTEVISARFTPAEADALRAVAEQGVSAYLREAALLTALRARPGVRVFRATSGAVITLWRSDLVQGAT